VGSKVPIGYKIDWLSRLPSPPLF